MTYASEADFIPKVMEATDTVLSILVVVVLDEAETGWTLARVDG